MRLRTPATLLLCASLGSASPPPRPLPPRQRESPGRTAPTTSSAATASAGSAESASTRSCWPAPTTRCRRTIWTGRSRTRRSRSPVSSVPGSGRCSSTPTTGACNPTERCAPTTTAGDHRVAGLYLCHVLCEIGASPLIPVLRSITRPRVHPRNVLLIDNEDYISPEDFAAAVRWSGLRGHVFHGQPGPVWPTLRQMIATRQQVVVLAEHDAGGCPGTTVPTTGSCRRPLHLRTPDLLIDPGHWPTSCRPNRGGTNGSLFLMNHWSPATPPPEPDDARRRSTRRQVMIGEGPGACQEVLGWLPSATAC